MRYSPLRMQVGQARINQARWAVAALFFTNGALYANVAPRFPEIKTALGLSDAVYGLSIAAFAAGALIAGLGAGALNQRWGAPLVATVSTALSGLALLFVGIASVPWAFAGGLFLAGAMDAITDVAQNDHGLRVQDAAGRSILNSFHATWSIGAVSGGAMAGAAIALGLPLHLHLTLSFLVFTGIAIIAKHFCLPPALIAAAKQPTDEPATRIGGLSAPRIALLIAISAITVGSTVVEDLGSSWASLYLHESLGLPGSIAAFGLVAVAGAQFVGRLLGDRMTDRLGPVLMARIGGGLVALGLGSALLLPSAPLTFLGFMAAGFGIATLVPSAFHAADQIPGLTPGTGLTIVAWLMRVTFLLTPPVVGAIADTTTLRLALGLIPIIGVLTVLIAPVLSPSQGQNLT
ncbi:MFS transporter [Stomatohabitans albus]|uniref:MFS transporter n=1 Tax=Stomatohabitans albus TaxID=3110766 RepID=UPI00300D17ED